MVYEAKGGPPQFSRNSAVGKGGLIVAPFLDVNNNGKFEPGEKRIIGLNIRIGGGRIEKNYKDSTIRVSELEPFTNYYIEMDRVGFENISWQIPNPVISVSINPNQSRRIEIPIKIVGEVSGVVFFQNDTIRKGIGRIVVSIYSDKNRFIAKIMSEEDGYFNYMGLAPGTYNAKIDENQLRNISMICYPEVLSFTIKPSQEGDQVDGVEFMLREIPKSKDEGISK
jgi:hypothetical protein